MEFVLIFAIAFILFFFAVRADNNRKAGNDGINIKNINPYDKAILEIEFPNHKRILEESISLIQTTNNLETLQGRYREALIHYKWIMKQKAKGYPIYFHTEEEGFENALNRIANYHIVRIATDKFINYKTKMYSLKTDKSKDNNTVGMFRFLEECLNTLKPYSNKADSIKKIKKLHDNTEDFYSTILTKK